MTILRRLALGLAGAVALAGAALAQDSLTISNDATFPPFEYMDNGKLTGFDVELMEAMAAKMGVTPNWVNTDFKGLVPSLVSRRADIAISAIYITEERQKVVDFSDPYYTGGLVIMTKADNSTISGPADLSGKTIAVQVGTKSVNYLREHHPEAKLVEVEKNDQMFQLVQTGRTDAAVTGKPAALLYAKVNPEVKVLSEQLTNENYGIAVRKDLPELAGALNKALSEVKADGTYDALVAKYFGN